MPGWKNSNRKAQLPPEWPRIRQMVFERMGRFCVHVRYDTGLPCGEPATDIDHIERGDDHRLENLRPLCKYHHLNKSSSEGGQAKAAAYAARKRPRRKSPGLYYD